MKYQNGYLPKIAYHMADNNHEAVAHFFERQVAAYGPITAEDMQFITRESARLQRMWANEMKEFNSHLG
jgi:hypothetical protein